jgi:outer membrane biosynthesis protein TonB
MPTPAQPNAKHKDALVESDHDTRLASQSKAARDPNSVMPDVVSKATHSSSLDSSPSSPATQKPQGPVTPQSQSKKQDQTKPSPTPPQPQQPQPNKSDAAKTPPQEAPKPQPKPTPPPPPKTPPPPPVDDNGLPVLPTINAQTMAPQTSSSQAPQTAPPPNVAIVPANMQGRAGMSGQPTPEAMKTDLGAYKARFYAAVGSRWYASLTPDKMQLIGVGMVRVQYTIYPDGSITTKVLDSGGGSMVILLGISQGAIQAVSPFIPFPPSMLKQFPNGYTDDFTFSIYGQ